MFAIAVRKGQPGAFLCETPDVAEPGHGQVVCRTLEVGVCGTDREIVAGGAPLTPPDQDHLVLGHECVAEVSAVGPGVDRFAPGDLVAPVVRRRAADCTESFRVDLLSWGQYVERGIVFDHGFSSPFWRDEAEHLVPVDASLRRVAVLTEPQSVAEKAANEAIELQSNRLQRDWSQTSPRTLVLGLGPIAFAGALAAMGRGWPVTMMGRHPEDSFRAQLATRLGASYEPLPMDRMQRPFDAADAPFDLVFECTGSEQLLIQAANATASRGVIAWLAASRLPRTTTLDVSQMMRIGILRNHLHIGSVNAAPRDFDDALTRLAQFQEQRPEALAALITKRVAPQDSLEDFSWREPQGVKVVLDYETL